MAIANLERLLRTALSMNKSLYSCNKTYLLGDNLQTQLNDIRASNKISKATVPQRFDKPRPYGRSGTWGYSNSSSDGKPRRGHFLSNSQQQKHHPPRSSFQAKKHQTQKLVSHKQIKVLVDNTTVQITLNKMGTSHSPVLNSLIKATWDWCIMNEVWLTFARIPGNESIDADNESRKLRRTTEWCLNKQVYQSACDKFNIKPNIDLFASRINY